MPWREWLVGNPCADRRRITHSGPVYHPGGGVKIARRSTLELGTRQRWHRYGWQAPCGQGQREIRANAGALAQSLPGIKLAAANAVAIGDRRAAIPVALAGQRTSGHYAAQRLTVSPPFRPSTRHRF